jgi:hypothetical protein
MKTTGTTLIAILLLTGFPAAAGPEETELPPGTTAEMMEAWQRVATPNEHHEHLARMAGTWDVQGTFWMQPGAPPSKSTGTSRNEMILGGRFLHTHYESEFMGQPFVGMGLDGFDNAIQKHVGVWVDSAGTMVLQFTGECSDGGKLLETMSEFLDPMSGELTRMKGVVTHVADDKYTFESWSQGPDGEFFKSMELTYTRKKS